MLTCQPVSLMEPRRPVSGWGGGGTQEQCCAELVVQCTVADGLRVSAPCWLEVTFSVLPLGPLCRGVHDVAAMSSKPRRSS